MKNVRKLITVLLVIVGALGGTICIYFASFWSFTRVVYTEVQQRQVLRTIYHIPAPWAILLFSMGFLGIICVGMDNKRQRTTQLKREQPPQSQRRQSCKPHVLFPHDV